MNIYNFSLLSLVCFCSFSFASTDCNEVLSQKEAVKTELAQLLLEKELLINSNNHALKVLIQTNVDRLVQEYQLQYGSLDKKEISSLLEDARSANSNVLRTNAELARGQTKKEADQIQILQTVFSANLGLFAGVSDYYLLRDGMEQSGVMWTKDEKYVLLRPHDDSKAVIINTQTQKRLKIRGSLGMLSDSGNYFAKADRYNRTTIYNLDSGKKYGTFEGVYVGQENNLDQPRLLFNERYICLCREDDHFVLVDYQNNHIVDLGLDLNKFVFSDDLSKIAHIAKRGEIDVIESSTGKILKTFKGNPGDYLFAESPPGFFKIKQGEQKYAIRFSDFKKFEAKHSGSKFVVASGDRSTLVSSFGYFKYLIQGLGKKPIVVDYMDEVRIDQQGNYALFLNYDDRISRLFDFKSYKFIKLPKFYVNFSADSAWLLEEYYSSSAYHIPSGRSYNFVDGNMLDLVPNSDFILLNHGASLTTLQGQLDGTPGFEIGEQAHYSPQGNFLVIGGADGSIRIDRLRK